MRKLTHLSLMVSLLLLASPVFSADQSASKDAAVEQAKRDYKVFLEQLKALNSQYKEITNEIKDVIKEEGVPAIDEETGEMEIVKPGDDFGTRPKDWGGSPFGDVDIKETDREMIVKVDLPGVKKEEIKVRIENNKVLRIFGQRNSDKEETRDSSSQHYYRMERLHGRFQRRVNLPSEARDSGIQAKYENGVLTVTIPKAIQTKKEINVSVR